jgi:hypothetical protein
LNQPTLKEKLARRGEYHVPSFDNSHGAHDVCVRQHNDGMGSKAKSSESSGGEIVTALCSVNSTGLIFLATRRLKVCSDITLTVQTSTPGTVHDWTVQGCVVECRTVRKAKTALRYRITLLFSDLPEELRTMLMNEDKTSTRPYPECSVAPVFGLN